MGFVLLQGSLGLGFKGLGVYALTTRTCQARFRGLGFRV